RRVGGTPPILENVSRCYAWCSSRQPVTRPPAFPLRGPPPIPFGRLRPRRHSLAFLPPPFSPTAYRLRAISTVPITWPSGRTLGCHCRTRQTTRPRARESTHTLPRFFAVRTTHDGSRCSDDESGLLLR